jgi:hypothetical protein
MKKLLLLTLLTMTGWGTLHAQMTYSPEDSVFVCRVLKGAKTAKATTTLFFARKFLNRPYVAHTLEVNDDERLVVNTRELDCTTFVENVLALTLCARKGKTSFADFVYYLRQLRYRGGIIDKYPSRLHYFSDWIIDNTQMKYVKEISAPNPPFTAVQTVDVHFMSKNPNLYKALRNHPEYVDIILGQEKLLTGHKYPYIPKSLLSKIKTSILKKVVKDGDVIALTANQDGLDIAHLGFALWKSDGLHFLHASSVHKKVEVEPVLFRTYMQKRASTTGFRLVRLVDPQ